MAAPACPVRHYAIHGLNVEVACHPAVELGQTVEQMLGAFAASGSLAHQSPAGKAAGARAATTTATATSVAFVPVRGVISPYIEDEVLRHVSPAAVPMPSDSLLELYQEGERFWLVDERWGLAEMNLLKGTFRSWVLPRACLSQRELAECAVLWPLAQLLRGRGLYLVPAAAVARDGWSVLILCPFNLEAELTALVRSGYRLIGQRWTALREEQSRVAMLHMPGQVQRLGMARPATLGMAPRPQLSWVDLTGEYCGAEQSHALCDAVIVVEPGRRAEAGLTELPEVGSGSILRGSWPIVELHPQRRHGQLAAKLARTCKCAAVKLSREPGDLLMLLDQLRGPYASRVQVKLGTGRKIMAGSGSSSAPAVQVMTAAGGLPAALSPSRQPAAAAAAALMESLPQRVAV